MTMEFTVAECQSNPRTSIIAVHKNRDLYLISSCLSDILPVRNTPYWENCAVWLGKWLLS